MKTILHWYRSFVAGVYNLWYYLPVIWKDRQWDHAYIEEMLRYKLTRMYKHMTSDMIMPCDRQEEYNKAMKICIDILERRKTNWYWGIRDYKTTAIQTEERDTRILFRVLDKYFESWWD